MFFWEVNVICPSNLEKLVTYLLEDDPSMMSWEAYKRKEAGLSPGEPGSIGALINGRMPPNADSIETYLQERLRGFFQMAYRTVETWAGTSEPDSGMVDSEDLSSQEWVDFQEELAELFMIFMHEPFMENGGSVDPAIKWEFGGVTYESDPFVNFDVQIFLENPSGEIVVFNVYRQGDSKESEESEDWNIGELLARTFSTMGVERTTYQDSTQTEERAAVTHQACSDTVYTTQ